MFAAVLQLWPKHGLPVFCLLALSSSASCSSGGGSNGNPNAQNDAGGGGSTDQAGAGGAADGGTQNGGAAAGAGTYSECVETATEISIDAESALGFSARDVLARVGEWNEIDLLWMPSNLYATHSRSGTNTSFDIGLAEAYDAPITVRFIDSQGGGCVGGDGPCTQCQGRLEIDHTLFIVSGDGALDEELPVTLHAQSIDSPTLSADIPAEHVQGTFLDEVTPEAGYSVTGLHIEAGYGVGFSGSHTTVANTWNGFVAATLQADGASGDVMQAHGYFPKETGM
jgi:hypothetical protein